MQAIMAQAGAWVTQFKTDLAARGLGFTQDDLAAVAAAAQAHPNPPASGDPAADAAEMQRVQQMAMNAEYPEAGFPPDDPRLTPMLRTDMAVATLYGQLFANATELPQRAG